MPNILVVDDSTVIRRILIRVIKECIDEVTQIHEAGDGNEALEVMEAAPVDLVFTDINMPNMTGLELLEKLRADPRWAKTPVIMITTEGAQAAVIKAVTLGANGYVRKPFTTDQIREKIENLMSLV